MKIILIFLLLLLSSCEDIKKTKEITALQKIDELLISVSNDIEMISGMNVLEIELKEYINTLDKDYSYIAHDGYNGYTKIYVFKIKTPAELDVKDK